MIGTYLNYLTLITRDNIIVHSRFRKRLKICKYIPISAMMIQK